MKRAAIIFLILMVGICLAPGAFAEEYMVVYIGVDSGDIVGVYGADELGDVGGNPEANVKVKRPKYHTNNGNANGLPDTIKNKISERSFTTIYATSSPGCRYIFYNGRYIKVCN